MRGLFAPLPLPHVRGAAGSALQHFPFAVMGHFVVGRAGGRTLAALTESGGGTPEALRSAWNVAQLANTAAATASLLEALLHHAALQSAVAAHAVYALWPVEAHLAACTDAAAVRSHLLRPLYVALAEKPLFRLSKSGQFVKASDCYFMAAGVANRWVPQPTLELSVLLHTNRTNTDAGGR